MVDVLAAPQPAKADTSLRTLTAISVAHWVSHFHLFVLPMLFPYLKAQLGVGYIELGFALTVFGLVSGLTQAPIGYLADHIGARKVLLIGLSLIAEGFGQHVPKGYIYFAMGFSVFVEMINLRVRSKADAVHLRRNLPE